MIPAPRDSAETRVRTYGRPGAYLRETPAYLRETGVRTTGDAPRTYGRQISI